MFYSTQGRSGGSNVSAENAARDVKTEVECLRHDVERLLMMTEALWNLLKREHGYEDEVLAKMIMQIDMRDGRADGGAVKSDPQPCPHCGKPNSTTRAFCIYCGKPIPTDLLSGKS
jgi:hypothetical protein